MPELCKFLLPLHVDCVEYSRSAPTILACGLYELVDNVRKGGICFSNASDISVSESPADVPASPAVDCPFSTFANIPGVFNLKWFANSPHLASASSDGTLTLYDFGSFKSSCIPLTSIALSDKMLLNLDISGQEFVAVDSEGFAYIGNSTDGFRLSVKFPAHVGPMNVGSEIWCCTFYEPSLLFTGADDCKLKLWDIRDTKRAVFVNDFSHAGGVTSVASNVANLLFTGAYDDTIRAWDVRDLNRPLFERNLGGGVWKIKFNPFESNSMLIACMYNGWTVVDFDATAGFVVQAADTVDGPPLLYGVDWHPTNRGHFVSSTFYDSSVRFHSL